MILDRAHDMIEVDFLHVVYKDVIKACAKIQLGGNLSDFDVHYRIKSDYIRTYLKTKIRRYSNNIS